MRKTIIIVLVAILCFSQFFTQAAFADNALRKLGRGLANTTLSWVEIPKQVLKTTGQEGTASGLTVGLFKGIVFSAGRVLTGVYETATFLVPIPEGYKPIIEPEFPFGSNTNTMDQAL